MLIIQRPTVEIVDEEQNNRQRFAIGPLDPGFGTTLGNSLRRTLLSSIPGGAVTQLRFDEALHEFTTLPGVKEDVTDIILNLKDLLVRIHTDEPVTLRLDVRGPADATAADLQLTADVEILNPDLYIATVNATGRLSDPAQFSDIVVRADPASGALVRLRDVARVELGALQYSSSAYFAKDPTVVLAVFQMPGSNALDLEQRVKDKMLELSKRSVTGSSVCTRTKRSLRFKMMSVTSSFTPGSVANS